VNAATDSLRKVMIKYKFVSDIPDGARLHAVSARRSELAAILKEKRDYSLFFGAVLFVYYLMKRFGLGVTFLQSKIILVTAVALIASGTFAGGKVITDYFAGSEHKSGSEHKIGADMAGKTDESRVDRVSGEREKAVSRVIYSVGVSEFESDDSEKAKLVSKLILSGLRARMGADKVTSLTSAKRNQVEKIVMGSVRQLGGNIIISARVARISDSKTIHAVSERIGSEEEFNSACGRIVADIARNIGK
jgi:hypothetical protein